MVLLGDAIHHEHKYCIVVIISMVLVELINIALYLLHYGAYCEVRI